MARYFYSCGGFNTPTLCVVTKGIKAECNHLMRTTYPDACVGVVDLISYDFYIHLTCVQSVAIMSAEFIRSFVQINRRFDIRSAVRDKSFYRSSVGC